jgi:lipopolysaccharide assembly outer membrane protein LptD (OstA)
MTYDLVTSQFAKRSVGIEFDCDCMNFKVDYTNTVDTVTNVPDNTLSLSVAFRTLGTSTGSYKF